MKVEITDIEHYFDGDRENIYLTIGRDVTLTLERKDNEFRIVRTHIHHIEGESMFQWFNIDIIENVVCLEINGEITIDLEDLFHFRGKKQ